ncbi:MAG: Wzz/FepE/Etk N-terminal domain-containing protein, partial [bacterium]|nr:Wzz/FepE/Etk N-terminal domain-containing protein [bacterium]
MNRPDNILEQPLAVQPSSFEDDEIDLFDYVEQLARRRWLILCITCLFGLSGLLRDLLSSQPERFQAEATFMPEVNPGLLNLQFYQNLQVDISRLDRLNALLAGKLTGILKSFPLNRKVIQKTYTYTLNGQEQTTDLLSYFEVKTFPAAFKSIQNSIEFKPDSGLITIIVQTRSPELSAAIANEFIHQLIAYQQEKYRAQFQQQLDVLKARQDELLKPLEQAEADLTEFQMRNRNLSLGTGITLFLTPDQSIQYLRLKRKVEIRTSLLTTVLNEYEVAQLASRKVVNDIEILSQAEIPEFSIPPTLRTNTV